MRPGLRSALLALFLLPLLWGLITLATGRASYGAPRCPGLQLDEVGEEHPGPMRPGFTCAVDYSTTTGRSTATSTYEQQKYAQERARQDHYQRGALYTAYGAAGLAVLAVAHGRFRLPWRRGPKSAD
jgi:hypothetical protein